MLRPPEAAGEKIEVFACQNGDFYNRNRSNYNLKPQNCSPAAQFLLLKSIKRTLNTQKFSPAAQFVHYKPIKCNLNVQKNSPAARFCYIINRPNRTLNPKNFSLRRACISTDSGCPRCRMRARRAQVAGHVTSCFIICS